MGDEGLIGEIRLFAGTFEPRNWAFCDGRLMSIAENEALYTIIGTTYGGDGQTTFALPDLRSRAAVGAGQGPGLQNWALGQKQGSPTTTLTTNQMPAHNHIVFAGVQDGSGTENDPTAHVPGTGPINRSTGAPINTRYAQTTDGTNMAANMLTNVGSNQPYNNMQPSLAMNYVICLYGIFPSRN